MLARSLLFEPHSKSNFAFMEGDDPPTAPAAERDDAKLAGEMEQLRKSLGRLERLTTEAPTPANAAASSAVSSSVSFSHGSASVSSHKLGSTVTWSDTPGSTAQGMTPAQGAEAVEALTEDFNDFFHSIASKYGLDTPAPADEQRPAKPQPTSAASTSATGFEFRVEHHHLAEMSVEGDDTTAAAAVATTAAGEDGGVASGEEDDDNEPSPMLPQHSGQSPERPKTSRGRPSVESEVWVVEPDASSTESAEEPDAMQQQKLQEEEPNAPPPPQHMEEVGEVGMRPDGFPHGTALPPGTSSVEQLDAADHVVAGVHVWLHNGADAGYTGAEQQEAEEQAYRGAHQEEDDVPLYESQDGHPQTRYTEAMDEGPDAYDLLEAMLPTDDESAMLRGSAQIMTSGGEEPTTLLQLNRMLRDNGFGDVSVGDSPARPADLLKRLSEVLCQYERRSTMVQELLAGTEMARQREERTAAQIRRLRAERDAAQREANAALLKAEALSAKQEMAAKAALEAAKRAATTESRAAAAHKSASLQLSQAKRDAEKALRRSDELYSRTLQPPPPEETELRAMASSRDALKGEVSQLEHQLRVKTQEVSRLQERLDDAYDKAAHNVSSEELELRRSQLARDQLERKVSQLEHAARAKAQEMSRLQEKLDELYVRSVQGPSVEEIELKRLVLARDQLNQKVSQLEHTVRAKDKDQQRLQEKLEELYDKSSQSSLDEAEMRKALSARDTLGNKVSQLEHACRAKDRQIAALRDKVQRLYERATATPSEEHMQELRQAQLARDALTQKVTMLENLGRVKEQECLRLQDKVQEMYEKTSGALTDEQLDEMRKLQVSRSQLCQQVSQLEHAGRVKEQDVQRLKAKVQELYERTSGGASSEEAAEETRKLQLSRSQLSAQVSQLQHEARVKDQDVARLKAKVQELYQKSSAAPAEEAAELRQALLARDQLMREVSQLEHAARAKDQAMAKLQDKVQELYVRASTTSAEEQAAELRRVQLGRDQAVQRCSQLEHLGRVKDQENARLQERLEDAYVKISSGSARDEQAAELRRTVTAKEALSRELAAVEVAGRAKELELERLRAKVQELYEKAAAGGGAEEREEEMRRLVLLRDQLTQKVSQLEHQCRAKDTERVRLQEMLDAVYGKLGSDTEETEALKLLHGRDAMNQKVQAMMEVNLRAKEQEVSRLQDKVAELYEKLSEASSGDDDGVLRKAQLTRDQLIQKVTLLEHSCRAREKEIQRLKESLEDKVRREEYRTIRDKEMYEKLRRQVLQGPAAVQSGTKGLKSADVVALYEGKREAAERELSELRAEVKQLSGELRERDNLIAFKDHGGGWRTPDAASLMERQEEAERSAAEAKRTLATLEAKAAAAQRSMQLQLSQADERNASLAEENGNLILELQSRPSVKQLRDAERRAEQLQAKLSRERAGASEAAMEETRQAKEMERKLKRSEPLLTAAQIKRDKAIHHLRLSPVARLPKDVLVDLVQDICIQLELDDVGLLESSVAKLLRVMRAVPRMERFIAEVSEVVFVDGAAHVHEHVGRDPHQVPTVLKGWLGSLATLASLHEFRKVVVHELSKRAGGAGGVAVRDSAAPAELAVQVKQLVEMERVHLLTEANFDDTAAMLTNKPDVLVNKIVSHFQSLFAAPKIDGVLAKMNQVYLQTTEQHNFMKVLRQLLGLDATAGVNACLKRLTHLLDEEAKAFDLRTEYVMGKLDEAKLRERAVTTSAASAPEGSSAADSATDRATEQHRHITSNLLHLYELTDPSKIVPHCEKLLERLHKLEDVLPKYQGVTGQLYELLRCTKLDDIVPSVRRLTSGGDATE